ncbi:MAG TPA: metalloregulator ArsR/SmtB family transcription factor [Candidatus Acidoferrales bacterium]|nr:metalloregulator ArsR/SmtB family transcription factor [Candidatus Acidoferrales bacterium]
MSLKRRKLGRLAAARRRDLFFALGEPTRRALIELMAEGEQPFSYLAKFFPSSRQAVLDHLFLLQEAGLVSARFVGNRRYYRLRNAGLREIRSWLAHLRRTVVRRTKQRDRASAD